jgi:hypothetical protein
MNEKAAQHGRLSPKRQIERQPAADGVYHVPGRYGRRAIVVVRDPEDYDFWETVCSNQGHSSARVGRAK